MRQLTIEWGQCDPAGIVYYPRYFEMFDRSTARLLEAALGIGKAALLAQYGILGIPVVDTGARFMAPSTFGDEVTILTRITECRRSSFAIEHRLLNGTTLAVLAHETRVWVARDPLDPSRIRAVPLPEPVRARLMAPP